MYSFKILVDWGKGKEEHCTINVTPALEMRYRNSFCDEDEDWIELNHGYGNRGIYPRANCKQILRCCNSNKIIKEWYWEERCGIKRLTEDLPTINMYIEYVKNILQPLDNI